MTIPLHISPRIIPSIATLYNDTNRIFMEYIDNSIDSSEKFLDNNWYIKDISISLTIGNDEVIIEDNSTWIINFEKVVQSIWNSDKKAQFTTNWQFWYGIYSFMAACWKIEIISKTIDNEKANSIVIDRKKFDTDNQEDVVFPDFSKVDFNHSSWTRVVLSKFDKTMWKQINLEEIKLEVEKHFELLLARKNLTIKLKNNTTEYICKPFNYDDYEGEVYSDKLEKLFFNKWRRDPQQITLIPHNPIKIFLKITKWRAINKLPVFVIKWRRIAEIKDIKQFKSNHKGDIWWHPNMTWYIDLSDYLNPTIARTEFKNNNNSKALFNTLIDLEPLILDVIKDVNKESDAKHYHILEDKLNSVLSKLSKLDHMNYRTDILSGNDINLEKWWSWQSFEDWFWSKDKWNEKNNTNWDWEIGENEWDWVWPSWKAGYDVSWWDEDEWDFASNKEADNPFDDTWFKWWEKKKSGFNIRLIDIDPPIDENDKMLRSQLTGSDIRIFSKHPDFEDRVDKTRKGASKITQRLITYLAWEITVHYKDKFQTKHGQPDYNIQLFQDLVDFIYKFEDLLKDLSWKNLSDFNQD